MSVTDNGPNPNAFDIETETVANENYRTVAWTGKYLQVTLMSIPVGQSIGLEIHPETDQFLRLDAGQGRCVMGPAEDQLDFEQDVSDGGPSRCRPERGTTSSTPARSRCSCTPFMHPLTTRPGYAGDEPGRRAGRERRTRRAAVLVLVQP